jgi:hypothetical protein
MAAITDRYASVLPTSTSTNTPSQTVTQIAPSQTTGSSSTTQSTGQQGITSTQNMDPASLAALQNLITTLSQGGTPELKAQIAKKNQTQQLIEGLLNQYTTGAANTEAQGLMALNLQKALDANMPAISRAVEGAGTSGSSMQALLAQNASRDAALGASALGAEQAKAYGGITANLVNSLSGMTQNVQDPVTTALMNALNTAKGATTVTQSAQSGTQVGNTSSVTNNPATTETKTYTPLTVNQNGVLAAPTAGLTWEQAMAKARNPSTGNVDWVAAANMLG